MGMKQIVGSILIGFSLIAWVIADAANLIGEEWTGRGSTYHLVGLHYIVLIGLVFAVGIVLLIWDWREQLTNILVKFKDTLFKPFRGWTLGWVVILLALLLGILIAAAYFIS